MQPQCLLSKHFGFRQECEYSNDGSEGADWRVGDDRMEVSSASWGEWGVEFCVWVYSGRIAFDLSGQYQGGGFEWDCLLMRV